MKKIFKSLTLLLITICLVLSVTACNFVSVEVKNPNNGPDNSASSNGIPFNGNAVITETYQKNYKVKSVDLKLQTSESKTKLSTTEIVDSVYDSTVAIISTSPTGSRGAGSGIIVDIDVEYESSSVNSDNFYYVITCHHVIDGAGEIAVYLPKLINEESGEYEFMEYAFGATLMGGSKDNDVAVLRIEIEEDSYEGIDLTSIKKVPINNEYLQRGQKVIAIGNPTGELPGSVTEGIISNLFVDVRLESIGTMKLFQLDAAVNAGNSGCGVFNEYGQLVGMVNSGNPDYDGIGFGIPTTGDKGIISTAKSLLETVTDEAPGYMQGKWMLGASFVNAKIDYSNITCIQIVSIVKDDTFDKAGIISGLYLQKVEYVYQNKTYTCNTTDLTVFDKYYQTMQANLKIGDQIDVYLIGIGSAQQKVTVTLVQYIYRVPTMAN